jgi:signal transduction histidine kinase
VALSATAAGSRVEIHVTDAGPGFGDDLLEGAFDRFTRGDRARTGGGSGLGLAIVERIARAHGGAARARNLPGGGADVWLDLPGDGTA